MPEKTRREPWMLGYTIVFGLLSLSFVYENFRHNYHPLYVAWSGLIYAMIFAGNLQYSIARPSASGRMIWKITFVLALLHFVTSGVIDTLGSRPKTSVLENIMVWIIGFALFFPTFRAHYLLGYERSS